MKKVLLLLFFSAGQMFFPCRAGNYSFVKGKIQRNDTSYVVTHHGSPDEEVKPKLYTTPEGTMKFEELSEEEEMCSLDFLTKGTWKYRFSTEEGDTDRDETSRLEATYSTTTRTHILKFPGRAEIVRHARYYLSKTLQSTFDESKVGKSLRGNYICVEDTANNGVDNYEIKGYTSDILTLKLVVDDKRPTYTNTFFRITDNPKEAKDETETDKVYQTAEKMPEFPGGNQSLLNWVKENIQYPVEAQKKGIQNRVIITFVINKNGKAVEPMIVRSVDPLLEKEAIRLVNSMPKWKPGEEKGEPVRVKLALPINFRLNGGGTTSASAQEEEVLIYLYDPMADKDIGFVNSKGETVIPADRFGFVYQYHLDKISFVLFNKELKEKGLDGIYAINRKGEPLFEVYCFDNGPDVPNEGLFRIIENDKMGFANMNGEVVIKPQFDFVGPFQECGYAVFNTEGKRVIYDTHNNYSTWKGGKWGIINKKGEIVLPPTYEDGYPAGFVIDDKFVRIEKVLGLDLNK